MALTVEELEVELRRQPPEVQAYLAEVLLDVLDVDTGEDADEAEVHRRAMEMERGEVEGIDSEVVIAALRTRPRPPA